MAYYEVYPTVYHPQMVTKADTKTYAVPSSSKAQEQITCPSFLFRQTSWKREGLRENHLPTVSFNCLNLEGGQSVVQQKGPKS